MIIVSDTSPICYLLLTGHIDILQELYGVVTIPQVVADELGAADSLPVIQAWIFGVGDVGASGTGIVSHPYKGDLPNEILKEKNYK